MIGDVAYTNLTTCSQRAEQHLVSKSGRSHQWADTISSFGLNEQQTETLKGLIRLKKLSENWDGESSLPPSPIALNCASELVLSVPFEDLHIPFVSPTSMGGVQLEWTQNGRELEIEFLPDGSMEFLTVVNGDPLSEGTITREQVPSLARWLRDETDQTGGLRGWVNSLART